MDVSLVTRLVKRFDVFLVVVANVDDWFEVWVLFCVVLLYFFIVV